VIAFLTVPDATVVVAFLGLVGISFTAWKGVGTNRQVKETNGWASHLAKTLEFVLAELHELNTKAHEMKGWAENHDEKHDIENRDK
jgi:hypothetical protein